MENLLQYFGALSIGALLAYLGMKYLSQKIFENYLAKKLEAYKNELNIASITHQIQFSTLHKERALVIKELYDRLYDYKIALIFFFNSDLNKTHPSEDLSKRLEDWTKAVLSFSEYFHKNRIYFSESQCEIIDQLNNRLDDVSSETRQFLRSFQFLEDQVIAITSNDTRFITLKNSVNLLLENEIQETIKILELEFRILLGVEISKRNT